MNNRATQNGAAHSTEAEVDQIVREVLKRLQADEGSRLHAPSSQPTQTNGVVTPSKGSPPAAIEATHSLQLTRPLVTLSALADRLHGAAELKVPRGAIVTPAARDYLRDQRVALRYSDETVSKNSPSPRNLVLGVAETRFEPAALIGCLSRHTVRCEQIARIGLAGLIDEMSSRVSLSGDRAVLFTGEPDIALCLANRQRGVRASQSRCVASARRAKQSLGMNLMVIEPTGQSMFQLEQILKEFCDGELKCPARYADRLN